jgi:hypothetical protein
VYKAQQETRAAEAQALRERQALVQTWVTSFASVKDSLLVTVTHLAGGLALVLLFVLVVVLLLERGRRGQENA